MSTSIARLYYKDKNYLVVVYKKNVNLDELTIVHIKFSRTPTGIVIQQDINSVRSNSIPLHIVDSKDGLYDVETCKFLETKELLQPCECRLKTIDERVGLSLA